MRDKLLYFPLPMPVWDTLTADLSPRDTVALWQLVSFYARRGGLPVDDRALAQIVGVDPRTWRNSMRPILAPKFPQEGWRWPEIDQQIAKREKISVQKSLAGAQGNFKRWGTLRATEPLKMKRRLTPRDPN